MVVIFNGVAVVIIMVVIFPVVAVVIIMVVVGVVGVVIEVNLVTASKVGTISCRAARTLQTFKATLAVFVARPVRIVVDVPFVVADLYAHLLTKNEKKPRFRKL